MMMRMFFQPTLLTVTLQDQRNCMLCVWQRLLYGMMYIVPLRQLIMNKIKCLKIRVSLMQLRPETPITTHHYITTLLLSIVMAT